MPHKAQQHSHQYLKTFRKELRTSLTPAEATLWKYLHGKKLTGRKLTRQHSIGNYIADFYCASERLIIELDGEGHFNAGTSLADEERDNYLASLGYGVLRFENHLVFDHLETVLATIEDSFTK